MDEKRLSIAVLDVETTGLNPYYGDRICEVGIVYASGDEVEGTYSSLINPQRPLSPGAAAVNGLTDELLTSAPIFSEIADKVLEILENRIIVCHNAPFDLAFLESELSRLGKPVQFPAVVDTLAIARRQGRFYSNSLSAIAAQLGLKVNRAHRALADALTTYQVWQYFNHNLDIFGNGLIRPFRLRESVDVGIELPIELKEALQNQQDIEIYYIDRKGNKTRRVVRPQELFVEGETVYLVAYCHLRQEQRHFRLDRIISISSWEE
ncbi:MAG: exonuclease domain-containing protein [Anaerolineales bacterium]